jgi:hypothetical protein
LEFYFPEGFESSENSLFFDDLFGESKYFITLITRIKYLKADELIIVIHYFVTYLDSFKIYLSVISPLADSLPSLNLPTAYFGVLNSFKSKS